MIMHIQHNYNIFFMMIEQSMVTWFFLLPRSWNILMCYWINMSCSLKLEIFFVIVSNIIAIGSWFWLCELTCKISQVVVDSTLLLETINIHISNRRNFFFFDLSSSCISPISLYSFHMPLVDNSYYWIAF